MTTYEVRMESATRSPLLYLIGAYTGGVAYTIYIHKRKESLEDFIAGSRLASVGFKRELTVSGVRGKEYAFEDDAIKRVTQFFGHGERIYTFHAQGSRLGNPDVDIPRFLESIKLEQLSGGLTIVNGPGDLPATNPAAKSSSEPVFMGKEVMSKVLVVSKPEPTYTDDARSNQITGTVVFRVIFSSSGAVTNIRVVSGLPYGLTEKAAAAAHQIKFIPAVKDGRFVSQWIQLEYNFNLY